MKIHIFGASGSGVTTLGKELSVKMNIPYFDSDEFFWEPSNQPFTIRRKPTLRNEMIERELDKQPDWIFGGSVINWSNVWLNAFDLVVFLWIPFTIRLERLRKREHERYGESINTDVNQRKESEKFLTWASGYDSGIGTNRTLAAHEDWLQKITCQKLEIRGDCTVIKRLTIIMDTINGIKSN